MAGRPKFWKVLISVLLKFALLGFALILALIYSFSPEDSELSQPKAQAPRG